jgi:hypothetical protein
MGAGQKGDHSPAGAGSFLFHTGEIHRAQGKKSGFRSGEYGGQSQENQEQQQIQK